MTQSCYVPLDLLFQQLIFIMSILLLSIPDLSPLGNMPYLLELDVSHNQISSLLQFKAPKNLKSADFSFNNIEDMPDLSAHHYLQKLVVDSILLYCILLQFVIIFVVILLKV